MLYIMHLAIQRKYSMAADEFESYTQNILFNLLLNAKNYSVTLKME